jgi:ferrous iron transport protein A
MIILEVRMMSKTLKDLAPGEKARIKAVSGNGSVRRRIIEMGLVPGVELTMERYAPLGDPVEVSNPGFFLSLRKEEADTIVLEENAEEEQ